MATVAIVTVATKMKEFCLIDGQKKWKYIYKKKRSQKAEKIDLMCANILI